MLLILHWPNTFDYIFNFWELRPKRLIFKYWKIYWACYYLVSSVHFCILWKSIRCWLWGPYWATRTSLEKSLLHGAITRNPWPALWNYLQRAELAASAPPDSYTPLGQYGAMNATDPLFRERSVWTHFLETNFCLWRLRVDVYVHEGYPLMLKMNVFFLHSMTDRYHLWDPRRNDRTTRQMPFKIIKFSWAENQNIISQFSRILSH